MTAILVFGYYNSGAKIVCDIMYERTRNGAIFLVDTPFAPTVKTGDIVNILVKRQYELRHNNVFKPIYKETWLEQAPDSYFDYIIQNNREGQEDLEGSIYIILRDIEFKRRLNE